MALFFDHKLAANKNLDYYRKKFNSSLLTANLISDFEIVFMIKIDL